MKRPQPQPPHTQGTFHRRLQPLYTDKHKVSCSGFLPKTNPMQQSCSHYNALCSTTSLTRMSRHTWQQNVTAIMHFTRRNTNVRAPAFSPKQNPMQQRRSHCNEFCSITSLTCMSRHAWQQNVTTIMQPLPCDLQAQIPQHPITAHMNSHTLQNTKGRTQPQPPHILGTFHRRLQPLYTEKHKVSCSQTNLMQQ